MKLCMRNKKKQKKLKNIPDAKFEADSSSSFGDMTSQNLPRKKGTLVFQIRQFTPEKRLEL